MSEERWKAIPGHPGYEASSLGRVRSVDRTLTDGRAAGGQVLTPTLDRDGYPRVTIGRRKPGVATLVALAWLGRPEVRHMNDDRQDTRPENLAWGSRRENERDKKRGKGKENRVGTRPSGVVTGLGCGQQR